MKTTIGTNWYRAAISIFFGLIGFYINFHTLMFPFGEYTVAILLGTIFPILVALSWGWKYGLLSALFGGCQSMWWLWGPSNGYAVFLIVPPFTLWIVWHGIFAEIRNKQTNPKWWLNMYVVEIPFRIFTSINTLTLARWAISLNPPPWGWGADAAIMAPLHFSTFVAIKQGVCAYIVLILADVLLSVSFVRNVFKLRQSIDRRKTGYIVGVFLLIGCLFWVLDSFFYAFAFPEKKLFYDLLALNIPYENLFTRSVFFIFCIVTGLITANILRRQRESELSLQKAGQEAIKREGFLQTLITAIPDLVWLKDPQGIYLSCNMRFERFFGAKERDIVGKTDHDFVDKELADSFRRHDIKAMTKGTALTYQEKIIFADDGHRELLETTKTPMFASDGQLIGVLGIGRDITERTHLQSQLAQAQKLESIGRLAGGVAHDYNNISSIIIGYSEFALEKIDPTDFLYNDLMQILTAAKRSTEITRQLLAFARKQTIAPKVLDLNDSVGSLLKMLQRLIGEDINLVWMPGEKLWPVKLDPSQVDQILANLCVNARDAVTGVGKVTIETENIKIDEDYCADHPGFIPGDFVVLAVSDDGNGMTQETMDNIFEPFFTTKGLGQGTGLGLATVHGIAKQNKGFINVYSELQKGTTIRIYLPKYTGPAVKLQRENPQEVPSGGGETVLLVEDDVLILELAKRILEDLGYKVFSSKSPSQAISLAKEYAGKLNLLITDVVMPEMNGRDLSEKLKAFAPDLKILFMSGYTANVIAHRGVLDDGVNFISKPFSKQELAIKVQEVLRTENPVTRLEL